MCSHPHRDSTTKGQIVASVTPNDIQVYDAASMKLTLQVCCVVVVCAAPPSVTRRLTAHRVLAPAARAHLISVTHPLLAMAPTHCSISLQGQHSSRVGPAFGQAGAGTQRHACKPWHDAQDFRQGARRGARLWCRSAGLWRRAPSC